jgi:NADPH:quinone reductase-like Zn-dependent oxidoreductase
MAPNTKPSTLVEATMKAIIYNRYGGPDVLRFGDVETPEIGELDVLVRVRAAGVDRGVVHFMTGMPYLSRLAFGLRKPRNPVLGGDVAGVVEAVGKDVTRFSVGDDVLGIGKGTFAEFARAREKKLVAKPTALTYEQAAALPISGITALQAVRDNAKLEFGQTVLVIGASGGVGTYAVQIAKALGGRVTGVCSASKADLVRSIGADDVIDYTKEDFTDGTRRWDVVLDIGGNRSVTRLRRALTTRGTLVFVGGEGGGKVLGLGRPIRASLLSPFVRQHLRMKMPKERLEDIQALIELVEAGKVTPTIEKVYALSEAPDAIRHLEQGRARGKLVITP